MSSEQGGFLCHEMQIKGRHSMYLSTKTRAGKQTPGGCCLLGIKYVHNKFYPNKDAVLDMGGACGAAGGQ